MDAARVLWSTALSRWELMSLRALSWGLMLFNIFVSDTDSGTECTLSTFADDTKLSGAVESTEGSDTIQRDLDKIEERAHKKLMKFKKLKCKPAAAGLEQSQI